ncbi:MAG: hypothetical protein A2007_03455 [Verrucomicrobia bacterium GWC2_42_7]|nr:MAG: hypothetical protein A2007_03455 [Verrucomicrobia bacterium GWC2_42_7]
MCEEIFSTHFLVRRTLERIEDLFTREQILKKLFPSKDLLFGMGPEKPFLGDQKPFSPKIL